MKCLNYFIIAIGLITSSRFALSEKDTAICQRLEAKGRHAITVSQFQEAVRFFTEAINLNKNSSQLYNNRGYAFEKLGRLNSAIIDYTTALRLTPNIGQTLMNISAVYYSLNQKDKALFYINKYIEYYPDRFQGYAQRGKYFYKMQLFDDANKSLLLALEKTKSNTDRSEILQLIGDLSFFEDKHLKSMKYYKKAIWSNSKNTDAINNLAAVYNYYEQYTKALEQIDLAIKISPYFSTAYVTKAQSLIGLKKYMAAIKELNRALQVSKNNKEAYFYLAQTYNLLGKIKLACINYKKSIALGFTEKTLNINCSF